MVRRGAASDLAAGVRVKAANAPWADGETRPAKPPDVDGLLARIQDVIAEQTGGPLMRDGARRLEAVLTAALARPAWPPADDNVLSREVTILLADLRGFTSISAAHPAWIVLEMLNRFLLEMTEVIVRAHGRIDKFMGDSIMVVFGAPTGSPDDVRHALTCAVEMQIAMVGLNEHYRGRGLPELYMGIGINTGTVLAGRIGSALYSQYTVIGDEVNLASRIESFSLRGQILTSQATFERCGDFVLTSPPIDVLVKGKPTPVSLREVLAIPSLGLQVPRQEIRRSPRVEASIPFSFRVVSNKIVMPGTKQGTIFDIGYHGILAELEMELPPYSDITLDIDLSVIGCRATDIYAKTLKNVDRDGRRLTGIEFTSVSVRSEMDIRHFVQFLIQGSETR
jgi:adenylate cyclase